MNSKEITCSAVKGPADQTSSNTTYRKHTQLSDNGHLVCKATFAFVACNVLLLTAQQSGITQLMFTAYTACNVLMLTIQ